MFHNIVVLYIIYTFKSYFVAWWNGLQIFESIEQKRKAAFKIKYNSKNEYSYNDFALSPHCVYVKVSEEKEWINKTFAYFNFSWFYSTCRHFRSSGWCCKGENSECLAGQVPVTTWVTFSWIKRKKMPVIPNPEINEVTQESGQPWEFTNHKCFL